MEAIGKQLNNMNMNEKIWVATDHHFGHPNIIKFQDTDGKILRDFQTIEEHDEHIIKCHNETVGANDIVIFGGDVGGDRRHLDKILPRMNGNKRLILGNHDKYSIEFYKRHFGRIRGWYMFGDGPGKIVISHFPMTPESFHPTKPFLNVHGHIHHHLVKHRSENYYNICPEHAGYYPLSVDHFFQVAKERNLF